MEINAGRIESTLTHSNLYGKASISSPGNSEQTAISEKDSVSISPDKSQPETQEIPRPSSVSAEKANSAGSASSSTPTPETKPQENGAEPEPMPQKRWTILFYSAADNDLEEYIVQNINDIESTVSIQDANFVVQLDRGKEPADISGGWGGCRRFKLEYDKNPFVIDTPPAQDLGQVNMSDPKTLQDYIEWGVKNYPAKHTILIIADHGGGWEGAVQDESHKGWMTLPQMKEAIGNAEKNTGKRLDIIGFDACLMGQSEVAYELKDVANYMVASEEMEGAKGWPFNTVMTKRVLNTLHQALLSKVFLEPKDAAKFIVKASAEDPKSTPTMSAIDLEKMEDIAKATDKLAGAIIESKTPSTVFKNIIRKTQKFGGYKDHYDFCQRLAESTDIKDEKIKQAAQETMEAIKKAVMYEQHTEKHPGAHGLTVHLPSFNTGVTDKYKQIAFAKDTRWDDAVDLMTKPKTTKAKGTANVANAAGTDGSSDGSSEVA